MTAQMAQEILDLPSEQSALVLRINSLLSSNNVHQNSLGATLALSTLHQSQQLILHQRDPWTLAAQNILSRSSLPPAQCFSQVIDLILCLLDLPSRSYVQSSKKDQSDSKSISTLAKILINKSDQSIAHPKIRSLSIKTLSVLLTRYSSILRPVGPQLESIALSNLLNLNEPSIAQSATLLLTQLYRLAQKTDQSTNWSKTIKATIGSIQIILDALLSPFIIELNNQGSSRIQLAPLEIASQDLIYYSDSNDFKKSTNISDNSTQSSPSNRIPILTARLERLINVLITILSQSTCRPVSVPLGELTELGSRLLLLGKAQVHDRADLDWKSVWDSLAGTPTCRAMGCRLLAKLAQITRYRFTPFSSQAITILSSEIESNPQSQVDKDNRKAHHGEQTGIGATDASVIYATYARIVSSCPMNPDIIKTSIPPIISTILRDIQLVYGRATPTKSSSSTTTKRTSKKSKSKKTNGEDLQDWNLQNHSTLMNHSDLQLVERALNSLKILFESVPYFFPSSYLTKSIRLLLNLSTNPSFISPIQRNYSLNSKLESTNHSTQSVIGSFNNQNNYENLSLNLSFTLRPNLRIEILNCLLKCLPIQKIHSNHQNLVGLNLAQTLLEICSKLINNPHSGNDTLKKNDGGLVELAKFGTNLIVQFISRPRVPVIFLTETQLNAEQSSESEEDDAEEEEEEEHGDNNGNYETNHTTNGTKTKDPPVPQHEIQKSNPVEVSKDPKINYPDPSNNNNNKNTDKPSTVLWSSSLVQLDHLDEHKKRKCSPSLLNPPPSKKNIAHSVRLEETKINQTCMITEPLGLDDDSDDGSLPQIHFDDDNGDDNDDQSLSE